jgi:cytochrome c oxidase subunit II
METPSVFDPRGPAAAGIAELGWIMFGLAAAIYVLVVALLLYALFRRRRAAPAPGAPGRSGPGPVETGPLPWGGVPFVVAGGVVLPAVVLVALLVATLRTQATIAAHSRDAEPLVRVIGRQWWWEVEYPGPGIVTANEVHLPTGRPVRVELSSPTVIHSFWVPQLHGKLDATPGRATSLVLRADRPGVFRGLCAEFCGIQHANMALHVVAEPPADFEAWIAGQRAPLSPAAASTPGASGEPQSLVTAGQAAFFRPDCIACHAIRGTAAQGRLGPDLTHVGSRRWLAAGTLENTLENMARFIADPQQVKPGNLMPDLQVDAGSARVIAAYLMSLK